MPDINQDRFATTCEELDGEFGVTRWDPETITAECYIDRDHQFSLTVSNKRGYTDLESPDLDAEAEFRRGDEILGFEAHGRWNVDLETDTVDVRTGPIFYTDEVEISQ